MNFLSIVLTGCVSVYFRYACSHTINKEVYKNLILYYGRSFFWWVGVRISQCHLDMTGFFGGGGQYCFSITIIKMVDLKSALC